MVSLEKRKKTSTLQKKDTPWFHWFGQVPTVGCASGAAGGCSAREGFEPEGAIVISKYPLVLKA